MPNPLGSFVWYELMTTDPDAAARFYGAVVGWKIARDAGPAAGPVDYRHIQRSDGGNNGGVLRLTPEMCAGGARPCWMGYLSVRDVDAAVKAITADGGRLLLPAFDLPVGRIAMIADPQGVPVYVMKPIPPAGAPDATSDVYWNELATPDLRAAKAFYTKHFGFAFNESMSMGELGDYCFIEHGGQVIGAMMQKPREAPAGFWNYYICVPALDVAVAAVVANGGKVLMGPHEVPGGEWIINGVDPQGAAFSLVAERR
jgi:predicted enzyme related to lactoylglutathione lyase